jgi:hypothetical protein
MSDMTTPEIQERIRNYFRSCLNRSLEHSIDLAGDAGVDVSAEVTYLRKKVEALRAQLSDQAFDDDVLDAARSLDIPGIRMDGFLLLPVQALSSMQFWTDGKLTSITHGKTGGDQTLIYNRTKKRLAKGQILPGPTQIRIERRLVISGGKTLEYLETMPNPFAKLQMVESLPGPPPDESPERWSMFEDGVKVRGLAAALALLPVERRTQYRKHLVAHPTPWWSPEANSSNSHWQRSTIRQRATPWIAGANCGKRQEPSGLRPILRAPSDRAQRLSRKIGSPIQIRKRPIRESQ